MRLLRFFAFALLLLAAPLLGDDPWAKVAALRTGQDVRIVKHGAAATPITGTFDELTADNLIIVVKKEQTAIPRDTIDRVDARPASPASRVTRETKSGTKDPDPPRGLPNEARTPQQNYSSSVSVGEKPAFETVFRRTATAPSPVR